MMSCKVSTVRPMCISNTVEFCYGLFLLPDRRNRNENLLQATRSSRADNKVVMNIISPPTQISSSAH